MRLVPVLIAAVLLAAPATAQAGEGDIIVVREPGSSAREIRQDAEVRLVKTLSIEHAELVKPRDGDVADALAELREDRRRRARRARPPACHRQPRRAERPVLPVDVGPAQHLRRRGMDEQHRRRRHRRCRRHRRPRRPRGPRRPAHRQPGEIGGGRETNGVDDDGNGRIDDYRGWDFVSNDNVPQDGNGHGTHVAGTIAAVGDNNGGVIGVAPRPKVVPLRALDDSGNGYMSTIAAAFDYAGDQGLRIVNASLGGGYTQRAGDRDRAAPEHALRRRRRQLERQATTTRPARATRARCRSRTSSASPPTTATTPARPSPTTAPRRSTSPRRASSILST